MPQQLPSLSFVCVLTSGLACAPGFPIVTADEPATSAPGEIEDTGQSPPVVPVEPSSNGHASGRSSSTTGHGHADTTQTSGPSDDASGPTPSTGGPAPDTASPSQGGVSTDLRITEIASDPEGADGGPASPEFVEFLHVGVTPLSLETLVIEAPSWPHLTANDLGLGDATLAPGEVLLIERYADRADARGVTSLPNGQGMRVAFASSTGLRNTDGALRVLLGGVVSDLVVYGAPQPSPFDDPMQWSAGPTPKAAEGRSLCRIDPAIDRNLSDDFDVCAPSPGILPAPVPEPDTPTTSTTDGPTTGLASTGTSGGTTSGGSGLTGDSTSTTDAGTTSTSPPSPPVPLVVIVEVLANAPGPTTNERELEFIEIENRDDETVSLAGWTVSDDLVLGAGSEDPLLPLRGPSACPDQPCLAPGQRAIIVGNRYLGPDGGALVLATDDTTIANDGLTAGEPVVLVDHLRRVVSTYRAWPDAKAEPYPIMDERALVRSTPDQADTPSAWTYRVASPGTP